MAIESIEFKGMFNIHPILEGNWFEFHQKSGIRDGKAYAKYWGTLSDGVLEPYISSNGIMVEMTCLSQKRLPKNATASEKRRKADEFMLANSESYRSNIERALKGIVAQEADRYNAPFMEMLEDFGSYDYESESIEAKEADLEMVRQELSALLEREKELDEAVKNEKRQILLESISKEPSKFMVFPHQVGILLNKIKI